jgi:predicted ATP-grasp superfamily ATP-dependent carboligase
MICASIAFSARTQAHLTTSAHFNELEETAPAHRLTASQDIAGARALVTDEHYKHSLGIVRQLGRQGVVVSVVAGSKESLACRSRYCREVILAENSRPESLVRTILQTLERRHFDLVIPVSYSMTMALAQVRDQLLPYTRLEVSPYQTIALAADKLEMTRLAQRVAVPAPRTIRASELDQIGPELRFPLVIKPQQESPGRPPIRYFYKKEQFNAFRLEHSNSRQNEASSELLVQEYIPGQGCGLFATYQNGVCKRVFMHRRVREYPATGGVSSCAESFYDSRLESHGRRMLDALNWHGVAMVEFRRDDRDGEYKLMEINPKFWGSLDLALAAGADFPGDLCQMALGHTLSFTSQYVRNLRFHWPFSSQGDLFHLWTRPQSLFAVAIDFLNPRVKSNVWLEDFRPNLSELGGLITKAFRYRKA